MSDSDWQGSATAEAAVKRVKGGRQIDMLHGPMFKNILIFALPLALCGIIQQLFTSADMAVIFRFEGSVAQSAVNSNGALVNLVINLFTGMSVGATVVVAEYVGKNKTDDLHSVTLTSMAIALVCGVALLGVGIGVSEPLLRVMKTPSESLEMATQYLRIYFIGMPFLMVYDFGAALFRGVGDTKKSLIILVATGVLNIGLNFLFVGAMHMSVAGVAIATVAANLVSAVMVFVMLMRDGRFRIRRGESRVRGEYVKRIAVIGIPAGLQGVVFSLANVLIQSAVNGFGAQAVAGNGDAVNFEVFCYYFVNGFAQTTVTFVGQNYSAGKYDRCRKAFRMTMLSALIVSSALCAVFLLGSRLFIRIYTTDEVAIKFALIRMWCVLTGSMIPCLYEVAGGALRGMGHSMLPAIFTIIGSCVLRIIWIYTVFAATGEFWLLLIVYPLSWAVTGAAMLISYFVICFKAGIYGKNKTPAPRVETSEHGAEAVGEGEDAVQEVAAVDSISSEE